MRRFVWVALFLFLIVLQGSFWLLWPNCLPFDILLPAIYFFALLHGETAGFLVGLVVGLIQDSLTPGFFGFHMLTRCAIGYGIGVVRDRVFNDEYSVHIPVIGLLCIMVKFFAGILIMLSSMSLRFWPAFMLDTVGFVVMTMLLSVPMFFVMKRTKVWAEKEEELYGAVNRDERNRLRQNYRKQNEGLRFHRTPNGEE